MTEQRLFILHQDLALTSVQTGGKQLHLEPELLPDFKLAIWLTAKTSFLHRYKISFHSLINLSCIHETQYHDSLKSKLMALAHSQ
jgi:hypothetical protein